jgi:hypothetical protein
VFVAGRYYYLVNLRSKNHNTVCRKSAYSFVYQNVPTIDLWGFFPSLTAKRWAFHILVIQTSSLSGSLNKGRHSLGSIRARSRNKSGGVGGGPVS